MSYTDALSRELGAVGIRGRLQSRIVAEFADHLESDPEAELGSPHELARQFADELGTSRARRAALATFAALAIAGVLFGVAFATQQGKMLAQAVGAATPPLGDIAGAVAVIAPQVAFVAGVLAALRVLRRRREKVLPRAEAVIIVRRAAVALGAGLATMGALAALAIALRNQFPGWWVALTLAAAGAGGVALLSALPGVIAADRVRPLGDGPAGDLYTDLGPLVPEPLRADPWWLALAIAGAVAVAIAVVGALQSDPYDGILRGILDAGACLAGFAVLGRYLGLRS